MHDDMETSHYMIEYNHFDHPPQGKYFELVIILQSTFYCYFNHRILNSANQYTKSNILMLVRTPGARKFYHLLKKEFGTLAFCRRWIDRLGETRYLGHLKVC